MWAAIEAGGTKFRCGLADADGRWLAQTRIATGAPADTMAAMAGFFRGAAAQHGPISGIGIASFGPIDINPHSADYGRFTTTQIGRAHV